MCAEWASVRARTATREITVKMNVSNDVKLICAALLGDSSTIWWIIIFGLIAAACVFFYMLAQKTKNQQNGSDPMR